MNATLTVVAATQAYEKARTAFEHAAAVLRTALDAELFTILPESMPNPAARSVLQAVVAKTGIGPATLLSSDRHTEVVEARYMAMVLTREKAGLSLKETGRLFRRGHTDTLQAQRYLNRMLPQSKALAEQFRQLRAELSL